MIYRIHFVRAPPKTVASGDRIKLIVSVCDELGVEPPPEYVRRVELRVDAVDLNGSALPLATVLSSTKEQCAKTWTPYGNGACFDICIGKLPKKLHEFRFRVSETDKDVSYTVLVNASTKERQVLCARLLDYGGTRYCIKENVKSSSISGRLWGSSILISDWLCTTSKKNWKDVNVLELGAGCGQLSLVLASLGARVVCTDLEEDFDLMKDNVASNTQSCTSAASSKYSLYQLSNDGSVSPRVFDWLDSPTTAGLERGAFNYIFAVDVMYNDDVTDALVTALNALTDEHTIVIVAYVNRSQTEAGYLNRLSQDYSMKEVRVQHGSHIFELHRRKRKRPANAANEESL